MVEGLSHKVLISLLLEISQVATLSSICVNLRVELLIRRLHRLVVCSEDLALFTNNGQFSDIFLDRFSSLLAVSRRGAPEHGLRVLFVSGNVCDVGASNLLVKAVDTVLQIGWILRIALGRLMSPEKTRPL